MTKKQGLGAWKLRVEGGQQGCQGRRCRAGEGGGDSVIPFIVVIVITGLVLPFVGGVNGFASLLHHVHQGPHQPLGALRWGLQR